MLILINKYKTSTSAKFSSTGKSSSGQLSSSKVFGPTFVALVLQLVSSGPDFSYEAIIIDRETQGECSSNYAIKHSLFIRGKKTYLV